MKSFFLLLFFTVFSLFGIDVNRSLVEIINFHWTFDYRSPWDSPKIHASSGSGFVIAPNLIMTNAHVAMQSVFLDVKLNGFSKRYPANVEWIGYDCDLAILSIDDKEFEECSEALEFGEAAKPGDRITVYGYPIGGEGLCLTDGIVSRNHVSYTPFGSVFPFTQIDAPVNPGNSGGPAIHDDKVVGVIFLGHPFLQSNGQMIPIPIIRHFLKDIEDEKYDGLPLLAIHIQKLDNPDIRKYFGMRENQTGVLVTEKCPALLELKEEDVLLAVEDHIIENDGIVNWKNGRRVHLLEVVMEKQIGETLRFRILRNKEVKEVKTTLFFSTNHLLECDEKPSYFVYAGLVFQPLSKNYLIEVQDHQYLDIDLFYLFSKGSQPIILTQILPDPVTKGYHFMNNFVVEKINGKEIQNLQDVIDALETKSKVFQHIELNDGYQIILDKESADSAHTRILERFHIQHDRSEDLR